MARKKENPHFGGTLEEFLREEGIYEDVTAAALKCVIAMDIEKEMKAQKISKNKMATLMKTSRSAVDRLLDSNNKSVTLRTLVTAASAVGKKLYITLE